MHQPVDVGKARQRFLEIRAWGDGPLLTDDTLRSPLFKQLFARAAKLILGRCGPAAREAREGIARQSIGLRLWRTCGADFKGEDDTSFEKFLYGLCLNNLRWACKRPASRKKEADSLIS